jgi:hypothetical protein
MTIRTITLDADDLDRVAAFLARILPDEIDEADRAALERFADAIDYSKPGRITYLRPGEVLARDLTDYEIAEPIRRKIADLFGKFIKSGDDLFPEPTVIGPDGAAHPARSRR